MPGMPNMPNWLRGADRARGRAFALAGTAIIAAAGMSLLSAANGETARASLAVTTTIVVITSVLIVAPSLRRLLPALVGLVLVAGPAMVIASALMSAAATLGVPFDVATTRLAAVLGWFLALAGLVPVVRRLGSPRMPTWLALLIASPLCAVAAIVALTWRAGAGGARTAMHFSFLYRAEDNATWVSHTQAVLRTGHLPGAGNSEYWQYSPTSSVPGLLGNIALRGRPSDGEDLIRTAVDLTLANQLLCVLVAAGVLLTALMSAFVLSDEKRRPPAFGSLLISTIAVGAGSSILAAAPILHAGHLSLGWANVGLSTMTILALLTLRSPGILDRVFGVFATASCAFFAAGSWPYALLTPVVFGILLVWFRRTGFRVGSGRPLGQRSTVWPIAGAVAFAAVLAGAPQVLSALRVTGVRSLSQAEGGVPEMEPTTLALAVGLTLAAAAIAYRRQDLLNTLVTMLAAAASTSVALIYLGGVLPGDQGTYPLVKSLHLLVAVLPVTTAALVPFVLHATHRRVLLVGTLVASTLLTTSPTFGAVLNLWSTMDDLEPDTASRLLSLSVAGASGSRAVCQPSPYVGPLENYACQRWADALSRDQPVGTAKFRLAVLEEKGYAPGAWASAQQTGFLEGAEVRAASEIFTGDCIPAEMVAPSTSSQLALRSTPLPGAQTRAERVGSIDNIQVCRDRLVIFGWAPFDHAEEQLTIWSNQRLRVFRAVRTPRPDVVAALGDPSVVDPGFIVEVERPSRPHRGIPSVCLGTTDASLVAGSSPEACSRAAAPLARNK
jgi:hypothetical protein